LSDVQVDDFLLGNLSDPDLASVDEHLDSCQTCRRLVVELARTSIGAGTSARDDAAPLPRGAPLGRFVVLDVLGVGGMGVVYAAYDPDLDRKVALKRLRPQASAHQTDADARDRLLREAQAMARLSHANVVRVYEVVREGDEAYIAMEYVAGETLGAWSRAAPRTPDEILSVFTAAGRGLAAAHAVDVVHRDFKPDNVLVDSDGRVCVGDFGLARQLGESAPASEGATDVANGRRALEVTITRTGTVVGTPAYMAPEQHTGSATDARTDQFGFCVALYEALYGERPFGGWQSSRARCSPVGFASRPRARRCRRACVERCCAG
jgi:serine/threonine protein kinase